MAGRPLATFTILAAVALVRPAHAAQPDDFAATVSHAQGGKKMPQGKAIRANVKVDFGGKQAIDGTFTFTTDGGRSRLEQRDGTVAVFDGKKAWVAGGQLPMARFQLRTWPYFALAPFKLGEEGVTVKPEGEKRLDGVAYDTARMTFAAGTGDSPDDWYVLYRDLTTGRLKAMAYVVTYGGVDPAAAEPHAIVYDDFKSVDGVTLSTKWTFRHWSAEKGVYGDPIGRATLSEVKFVAPAAGEFQKPPGATEATVPSKGE